VWVGGNNCGGSWLAPSSPLPPIIQEQAPGGGGSKVKTGEYGKEIGGGCRNIQYDDHEGGMKAAAATATANENDATIMMTTMDIT
jgi:hypothetical protein